MPRKSIELKDELGRVTNEYRQVLDDAGKNLTADDRTKLATMDTRMDQLAADITMYERQEAREASQGQTTEPQNGRRGAVEPQNGPQAVPQQRTRGGREMVLSGGIRSSAEYDSVFDAFLRTGSFGNAPANVRNAMQADSDTGGGFYTTSEQFANRLIEAVDSETFFRSALGCTVTTLTDAQSLGIPTRASDLDDIDWTTELATGNETQLAFGKRELKPHPMAKRVKLSKKLMRLNSQVVDLVLRRLGYKFATTQEWNFMNGNGVQRPLGVFVPSTDGISTARDVSTGNTTGFAASNGADVLFDALYTLKSQYQRTAKWIFHRDVVRAIRKMKDGEGRYIWQPGIVGGQPATILDRPFFMSEFAPNTFTTGQYIGILGDFSNYEIVDALNMEVQRLDELYAETNQVGFIARAETDGAPVLEEAFVRLKTA